MLQTISETNDLERLCISLEKKLPLKMGGTLEIDVLVAKTKYLDDRILILLRKGLQVVINSNEE